MAESGKRGAATVQECKISYKGYQAEINSDRETDGWQAWANITPSVSAIHAFGAFSILVHGYETQQEAESALREEIKKRIDQPFASKRYRRTLGTQFRAPRLESSIGMQSS